MPTITVYTSKDASAINASLYNWSGSDQHHPVGMMVSGGFQTRSVIYFPLSFSGWKTVSSATLHLRGSKSGASHCFGDTSSKVMHVQRQDVTWGEDTSNTEGIWANRTWDWTTLTHTVATHAASITFPSGITDGTWYSIDVTDLVNDWKNGVANYGFLLINTNESSSNDGVEFYSREKGTAYRPYLTITYTTNSAPNAPTGLYPTGNATVASLTPVLSGNFSDPDAGDTLSAFQILAFEDDGTTQIWDSGALGSTPATNFSITYAGDPLSYNTFYKWKARTRDAAGLWGPYSTLQRFQTVNATPPDAITGFSATVLDATIFLDWDVSTLSPTDFDHYEIYRRVFGTTEWSALTSIFTESTVQFTDSSPSFGVTYEYKITQFENVVGGFDIESADSDIVQAALEGDADDDWVVVGADGLDEHTFIVHVTNNPFSQPVQQEIFEPLGSDRKTIARGRVLGAEGTIEATFQSDEVADILPKITYITSNRGPHVLRSPFGEVWLVEFSGPTKTYLPGGHLELSMAWTEVA